MGLPENGKKRGVVLEKGASPAKLIRRRLLFSLSCVDKRGNLSRTMMLSSFPLLSGDDDDIHN